MHDEATERSTTEARRFTVEVIAALVDVKGIAADRLLRPAGVPEDLVRRFLNDRNSATGKKVTKREFAVVLLDELDQRGLSGLFTDKLIEMTAQWTDYHLADDEIVARGLSQKALSLRHDLMEIREQISREQERHRHEVEAQERREREDASRKQHDLLLMQFDDAMQSEGAQRRGYLLEDLLARTFGLHGVEVARSFRRNEGGEQIDGAFRFDGWHYIVECRWRAEPADMRQLDGLVGQVGRSGHQTMGVFLSINGWSSNVVPLLKQGGEKRLILMDGYDLRCVLARQIELRSLLISKIAALNFKSEPFLSAGELLRSVSD